MILNIKRVKIVVTIPPENTEEVRNAICEDGAGIIGNYSYCSISTKCLGSFKPNDKAHPFIGKKNRTEFVEEEKLEFICSVKDVKKVVLKIKEIHPYEEVGIDIIPLLDENDFN